MANNKEQKTSLELNTNDRTKVIHSVPSVFDHLIDYLNECRETGRFCDWILKSEDGLSVQVHRIVLISTCPYFRAMFNSGLAECRKESFLVKNTSGMCLQLLIDYLYKGDIQLTVNSSMEMLNVANYMCLSNLSKFCLNYLIENIDIENCLDLWRYSKSIDNEEMKLKFKRECLKLFLKNLKSIQENLMLMISLEFEEVLNLLISNKIVHKNDENICSFVMKWITTDFVNRNIHIKTIMNKINFDNLTHEFINNEILQNEVILESKDFLLKIMEVFKGKLEPNGNGSDSDSEASTSDGVKQQQDETSPPQSVVPDNDNGNKSGACGGGNGDDGDDVIYPNLGDEEGIPSENDEATKKFKITYNNICNECELCETWHVCMEVE